MIGKLFMQDVRFQFRHGFYYAYVFVTLVYMGLLLFIPLDYRAFWTGLIVFSDPGTLGFFFVGAIVMLERNQQLLTYMFITPVRLLAYLAAKVLSLTLIAWLTSVLIAYAALGLNVNLVWLTIGVVLCSFFFTSVGLAIAVDAPSLNHFLLRAGGWMAVFYAPILHYVEWVNLSILEFLPSTATLRLLELAFGHGNGQLETAAASLTTVGGAVLILAFWGGIAFYIAQKRFKHYILSHTGESREVSA